jgi:hypothetical protein
VVYELRIYRAAPGKLAPLIARFRDHTVALFEKHGITNVGYWRNAIGGRSDELWYMLSYPDMAARDASWAAFAADPDWQRARADSEADGTLLDHLENRILAPTDFSPLK